MLLISWAGLPKREGGHPKREGDRDIQNIYVEMSTGLLTQNNRTEDDARYSGFQKPSWKRKHDVRWMQK